MVSVDLSYLPSSLGMEYAKTVVHPTKEVAHRSTIRGFKDDYYDIDADVVVLAGETHLFRKPVSRLSHTPTLTLTQRRSL
jgi:hypothetical protein